jgi:hypothetical protein
MNFVYEFMDQFDEAGATADFLVGADTSGPESLAAY